MTRTKSRIILGALVVAAVTVFGALAWAGTAVFQHHDRAGAATPAAVGSTPASSTPSSLDPAMARGQQVAALPAACLESSAASVACRYIIASKGPDSRLDEHQMDSWRRTEPFSTVEYFNLNKGVRTPAGGDAWWPTMKRNDGWVEPVIDNVLGADDRQAPGARPSSAQESRVTVVYHLRLHMGGGEVTTDSGVRQETLLLTSDARPLVSGIS